MIKVWTSAIKQSCIAGISTTKGVAKKMNSLVKFIFIKVWTMTKNVFKYINAKNNEFLIIDLSVEKIIFSKIWTSPRDAFRYINEMEYNKNVNILFILFSTMVILTDTLENASIENENTSSFWELIIVCLIYGIISGLFVPNILFPLLSWTGSWLKGQGNKKSLSRVISYATIPSIVGLILQITVITIFNGTSFLFSVFAIWTLVLIIIGISEVQKFSISKAISNILLMFLVIFIPVIIILLLIWNSLDTEYQSKLLEEIFGSDLLLELVLFIFVGISILLINKVVPMKWLKD